MKNHFIELVSITIVLFFTSCSYDALDFEVPENTTVIERDQYIELNPVDSIPKTCFLFYPGALVEPDAYISTLQPLCKLNCKVIIIKTTADLAILDSGRASAIAEIFPAIENWIIGGHSLGGVVAVMAINKEPEKFKGLVLFAAYPNDGDDLSSWNGSVLSLSAKFDGLTTREDIESSKRLLPEAIVVNSPDEFASRETIGKTLFYEIEGGNHAQFGYYGEQKDDGIATITVEEQHNQIVTAMSSFFVNNGW